MSQRDRLMGRALPSAMFSIQMEDPAKANAELQQARKALRQATVKSKTGKTKAVAEAQAKVDAAQARVESCWEHIKLTAMPLVEYQRLIAAHPPTPEQTDEQWNPDTFQPALLEACAEGDLTADDWREFLAEHAANGEARDLWITVLGLNEQARMPESVVLPKGLQEMRSLLSNLT